MSTNYVAAGDKLIVVAPAAVSSGDAVLVGSIFGVCVTDAASAANVVVDTVGIFTLPKISAQAWTVGQKIYWDATPGECTSVSTDNTLIGVATAVAANPSATGNVRLNGSF